ncbi:MAG: hypothetical protein HY316_07545 [Acidobacteria bacterium]|nr:hypothetical protein [Acidobacteriota bacterium]
MAYEDFTVTSPLDGSACHCRFRNLMTGIAPRHSDSVDVWFLVDGKNYAIALAHPAFALFQQRIGRKLTDTDSIQMAGLFLKGLLERGERLEGAYIQVSVDQTLELAQQVRSVVFT